MKKLISSLLAIAMVLALFSGVVIFNAAADEVQMHIPFINQYTLSQAQKMGTNNGWSGGAAYANASGYSFAKDDEGRTVISCTLPAETDDKWHLCNAYLSTGTNATPFVKDGLIDGINIFGDAELSNKTKIAIKVVGDANFQSAFTGINLMLNSGTERVCLSLQGPTKSNGYLIYDFSKITRNGYDESGIALPKDAGNFLDAFDGRISTLNMAMIFNKTSLPITFWFEDVYLIGSTDTVALHKAIREAKAAGITGSALTNAENVYKNLEATQVQVDAAAEALNEKLDEISFGYDKYKELLGDLVAEGMDLGFMDDTADPYYGTISDANAVWRDTESTLDDYIVQVRNLRDAIAATIVEDDDLYEAFALCNDVWKYNYTSESFKALTAVVEEAWASIDGQSKAGNAELIAKLENAYDALVPLPVRTTTANFFEGWTDTAVNEVVTANSEKLGDYILGGNCDFSKDTIFEANNNLKLTAGKNFTTGAMGWKNMDRSGTLASGKNFGYPVMNVAGLSEADGIRFKLEVADGSIDKFVVGISNCADLGVKEQHAMNLQAAFVDAEGYINVPFNYFKTPATWAKLFTKEELEKVVVVLVEYYGAEEDTEVTISDLRGYKELEKAGKEDVARLNDIVAKLQAFDIAGRYTDLVDAAAALDPLDNYTADYDDVYDQIFAVLEGYKDPAAAIVDVPGYSIYTQEELNQFPVRGGSATITKSGDGIKVVYQSKYRFANGIATGVGGYEEDDCEYGEVVAINGKTFIEMIGGYKLNQIFAYRFKIDGGTDYICINYKDGPGKYTGMTTKPQTAYIGSDGYYTFKTADVPVGKFDNWYEGNGYNLDADAIREHAKFILFDATKNQNKLIYGWQVILYETIDRSALKQALADYAELGVAGYDDALAAYYNKDATQKQVDDAAAALIDSATPDAPAAPTAAEVTYNSVTLTLGPDSIEYRMGENGEWSGQTEYTGLEPNTEYSFYARVASIGGLPASEPSKALVVKTLKAPIAGEIAIEGEAVYGKTLTATATVTTANPGDLTYTWLRGEAEVGTGTEYVLGKDDIGAALAVSVTAANLDGVLTSDPTAVVVKATPVITTAPADSVIMIGDKLSNAALTGGEVDVPGTWRWADPELVPALTQSGTAFPVIFTPEDTDCYNTVTAYVVVSITSDTEEKTVVDEKTGIKLTGDFVAGSNPVVHVADIKAGDPAYLALLRAARASQTAKSLILFKSVTFDTVCYVGTLKLGANIGPARAGQEYTVWFFANGEVQSAQATVDAEGEIVVNGFIADIA